MAPLPTLSRRGTNLHNSFMATTKQILDEQNKDHFDPVTNPHGIVNLTRAENFAMTKQVVDYVNTVDIDLTPLDMTYGEGWWGTARFRKALAHFIQTQFHSVYKIDPDELLVAAGLTAISQIISFAVCDPGDGILFSSPIYQGFNWDVTATAKVNMVFTYFDKDVDQFSAAAAPAYEKALLAAEAKGIKVRALMLVNPHNPLGRCYTKEALIALMMLCDKYSIHLLCDEVYATSVYGADEPGAIPFTSALSLDHSPYIRAELVSVLYSLSKDLAAGGLRLGSLWTRNQRLLKATRAIGCFSWPSSIAQQVGAAMLEDERWYEGFLKASRQTLAARSKLVKQKLDEAGIGYSAGANAGFFLWIDLRAWLPAVQDGGPPGGWEQEQQLTAMLTKRKVQVIPGSMLGATQPGFFRVTFSLEEAALVEGLTRMKHVLDEVDMSREPERGR